MTALLRNDVLIQALRNPVSVTGLNAREWTELLHRARSVMALGKLAQSVRSAGIIETLPGAVQRVLAEADVVTAENARMLRWESRRVERALFGTGIRPVLLKGGAYIVAGLRAGVGRLASDLDILVAQKDLPEVEARLIDAGWRSSSKSEYDDRYYREWMHEIPPLQHENRYTTVDVHHTILPPTGRLKPDAEALLAGARPIDGGLSATLAPADMLLHCAVHLFQDSDISNRIRDLLDLHELFTEFGADEAFWPELAARAKLHGLARPAWYAIYFTRRVFGTEIPDIALAGLVSGRPSWVVLNLMDALVIRALPPDDDLRPVSGTGFARWLLYLRSHWLRMPPFMLARHLAVKILARFRRRPGTQS